MIERFAAYLMIGVAFACSLAGCGSGQKEVVIQAPTQADQDAQLKEMTPEQRAAAATLRQAAQAAIQRTREESGQASPSPAR